MTTPIRQFQPLTASPLLTGAGVQDGSADLAVRLAREATLTSQSITGLLAIAEATVADRIATALDERTDLPPELLARLVAHRPDLRRATAQLKNVLFPASTGACHTFARTVAALAHRPESLQHEHLSGARFQAAAAAADPDVLVELLGHLFTTAPLAGPVDAALGALLNARAELLPTAFDRAAAAARERTRRTRLAAALASRRGETVREIAEHTGGLTLAAERWYDALTAAAETPEQAGHALALAVVAAPALLTGQAAACPWPGVRRRWNQLLAHRPQGNTTRWDEAWSRAAANADGSRWDTSQRSLISAYDLLADHIRTTYPDASAPPTPDTCWAADPAGRELLHEIADHLTGHLGQSPLVHFDDTQLIRFVRALAKNRRDKIPGVLHVHGLIAAIKAARSKTALLTRAVRTDLGIVIPARNEAHRLTGTGRTDDPLTAKLAQLSWLLSSCPDTRATVLLVDEAADGATAQAAQQLAPHHPGINVATSVRPDTGSAKGGAVLWGLRQLLEAGHSIVAYTDFDLTYPLDQLGLHVAALDRPGTGAVIGSRRLPDSHGYYPPAGPTPATRLYRRTVSELLDLNVTDPQAGFKAFTAEALTDVLPQMVDRSLAFDTELLATVQAAGHHLTEVGIAALHRYVDGQTGTPRDYDAMLTAVRDQAVRLGLDPAERTTPTWDRIRQAGSLAAAASLDLGVVPGPR
ncbi:glycosyltransferase [Streptomyces sp. SL13]|uniref:Glycosyltransferase n=1 Tax=Streptantibioticus silvisoli TaxID=2705255 RepID=A0AA90H241_9ACTN|nr:glycosyltransferase [Streptantibioticus silvisoli]MDI5969916.1 glycosyltransferase [Streptantibioticus silvisoli]